MQAKPLQQKSVFTGTRGKSEVEEKDQAEQLRQRIWKAEQTLIQVEENIRRETFAAAGKISPLSSPDVMAHVLETALLTPIQPK